MFKIDREKKSQKRKEETHFPAPGARKQFCSGNVTAAPLFPASATELGTDSNGTPRDFLSQSDKEVPANLNGQVGNVPKKTVGVVVGYYDSISDYYWAICRNEKSTNASRETSCAYRRPLEGPNGVPINSNFCGNLRKQLGSRSLSNAKLQFIKEVEALFEEGDTHLQPESPVKDSRLSGSPEEISTPNCLRSLENSVNRSQRSFAEILALNISKNYSFNSGSSVQNCNPFRFINSQKSPRNDTTLIRDRSRTSANACPTCGTHLGRSPDRATAGGSRTRDDGATDAVGTPAGANFDFTINKRLFELKLPVFGEPSLAEWHPRPLF